MKGPLRKLISIVVVIGVLLGPFYTLADTQSELESKIAERAQAIRDLETDISNYQQELKALATQHKSLQNDIRTLDLTRKKLVADTQVTTNKISQSNYKLDELSTQIVDKEDRVNLSLEEMAGAMRALNQYDDVSLVSTILSENSISSALDELNALSNIEDSLRSHIADLKNAKADLVDRKTEEESVRKGLIALQAKLNDQKKLVDINTAQKNKLLSDTKDNESNYQKALNEKIALRDSFEQELLGYESQLNLLNANSVIPPPSAVLSWPLDDVYVTQYFGDTAFARANSQVYNGKGHNGIDLRASVGTPIKSALSGTVLGVGDTDTVCPGASYGKWVVVKHDNGLSTLYAHLSLIKVAEGQSVSTGDLLGYSGSTGYATGPHLHFTVFVTAGMEIVDRQSRVCNGVYHMPIADLKAYLNPISYLPAVPN